MKIHDHTVNHTDWHKIAKLIHDNYSRREKSVVDNKKLLIVLQAFEDLYDARVARNEGRYYIGNLLQSAGLEGKKDDVVGTVSEAVKRTRHFILKPSPIYGRQAGIYARNFIEVLRKESFNSEVEVLLAPYKAVLRDLADDNN